MKRILPKLLAFALLCGLASCTDIDNLSDENRIKGFSVSSHSPEAIELGAAEIEDDIIYIPVVYGENLFPMTFRADVRYEDKIDRVMGLDFRKDLELKGLDDELNFIVVAKSGLGRRYYIKPRVIEYEAPEWIPFTLKSVPTDALLYRKAGLANDRMTFYVAEATYPLTITPEFDTDGKITFEDFDNGSTALTFASASATQQITVVDAAHGSKRSITVGLRTLAPVTGSSGDKDMTNILSADVSVAIIGSDELEYKGFLIDNEKDVLSINVAPTTATGEFLVSVTLEVRESADFTQIIGLGDQLIFTGFDEPAHFYYIDAERGTVRRWKAVLTEYDDPLYALADVTSFTAGYSASTVATSGGNRPAITLDMSKTRVDAQAGEIILSMTDVAEATTSADWKLELTGVAVEASPGAKYTLPSLVWSGNGSWQNAITFDVTARNGNARTWKVRIRDSRSYVPGTECDITAVAIRSLVPTNAVIDPEEPVTLDQEAKRIYIRLKDEAYPLNVWLDCTLSDGAQMVGRNSSDPLTFNDVSDINVIEVLSEDGEHSQPYQVKIVTPVPVPDVRTFTVASYSSSVFQTVGAPIVDSRNGIVDIVLERGGKCPVTVNYRMSMERDVTADIPLEGSFTFKNLNEVKTFTATVGDQVKVWTVRFSTFTPQLINWQLDSWSSTTAPTPAGTAASPYWATANNSMVSGTEKTTGKSGSAAKLTTGRVQILAIDKLTSGSIFLGYFKFGLAGLSDPVSLTFQGIEFSASKKIIGFEADIQYSSAGDKNDDTGSLAMELIRQDPTKTYEYHGMKPVEGTSSSTWKPHPKNTAVRVARGRRLVGNLGGTQDGETVTKVTKGQWTKIKVELDYSSMGDVFDYTHLLIICASSSQGDVFIGEKGSELKIDNVKLIYEE